MPKSAVRDLPLSGRQRKLVADLVKSGRYDSEKHVVDAALKLLEAEERDYAECVEGIRRGLADVAAGRVVPAEEVFARMDREIEKRRRR
jgi:antitoxin ParD1/3/4